MKHNKHSFSNSFCSNNEMLQGIMNRNFSTPIPVYSSKRTDYPELHLFKHQIDLDGNGPLHQPYTAAKSNIGFYRMIFMGIGIVYFALGLILYFKPLSWESSLIFGNPSLIKAFLYLFCGASSSSSLVLGFLIRAEKEAIKRTFRQAKDRIRKIYERKVVKFGIRRFFVFGEEYRKYLALRQHHYETIEKLHEYKEHSINLANRIANSKSVDKEKKELLFNQAVLELIDKMELVVSTFRTTQPHQLVHRS